MTIIAIESSGMTASVAIAREDRLVAEYSVNYKKTHSQTLLPMLDELCRMVELDLSAVDAIAVSSGPGSFTGLRIGSATAKGIGLALDKPLIGVPTLEALAANAWGMEGIVCPMMDARREQVYTAAYRFESGAMTQVISPRAVAVEEILSELNALGERVYLLGDGADVYRELIARRLCVPCQWAPLHMNAQRSGALARRAMDYAKEGKLETAAEHRPDYLRRSQAEREREKRERDRDEQGQGEGAEHV